MRLSPHARLDLTSHGIRATSPIGRFELSGPDVQVFVRELVPLLDGSRTEQELAESLPGITPESVRSFLDLLLAKGVVEPVPEALAAAHVVFVGLEPVATLAAAQLAAAGVGRISLYEDQPLAASEALARQVSAAGRNCMVEVHPIPAALGRADMGPVHEFDPRPSLVVNAAAPERMLLRFQLERATQAAGITSVSVHLEGHEVWLGPVAVPGQTACWNCLRMRRLAHREDVLQAHAEQAQWMSGQFGPPRATTNLAAVVPAVASELASELMRLLCDTAPRELVGRARVHNLLAGTSTLHGVVRMPWCPVCGGAQQALDAARAAGVDMSGVDKPRVTDLPTLFSQLEGWLDPRCGVIRSFETHPPGQPLPRTANVGVANYTEGDPTRVDINLCGGGKGVTDFDAQIGAIGEAIERYSASRYRPTDLVRARLDQLEGDAVDPRRLCLYEAHVYAAADNPYVAYDPAMPIDWMRGHWFGTRDPVWVPALAALFSYRAPPGEQLFQVSSSGLAAGASTVDAAVRATFELIERDATMLTWLCQLPGRPLLLDAPLDAPMAEVKARVEARGVRIEAFVLDVGAGVPTVFCLGFGDGVRAPAVTASLACHGDLRTAVRKALLELAHVTPYLSSITQERIPRSPSGVRTLEDHAFFYIPRGHEHEFEFLRAGDAPPLSLAALPPAEFPSDPAAATEALAERLRAAKLQVAIVELTAPDVQFTPYRVARAVGLDMQPIHFGHHLRRICNPRLRERLGPKGLHPAPHPIA